MVGSPDSSCSAAVRFAAAAWTRLGWAMATARAWTSSPRISADVLAVPISVVDELAALQAALEKQPDQSATENAQTFLTVAQDQWIRIRLAQTVHAKAITTQEIANSVYDAYCAVTDEALTNLYTTVENDFSSYYRQINADDESSFTAKLEPSAGKLDFKVDFYGIDMFPPAAYHSEGHQDGMGVCLYLALAKQILADDFRFAVLDDVVMSVDSHHRRQFCRLLKETFPDVQFIITTHDEVWARQMQASGLIGRKAQARFHVGLLTKAQSTNRVATFGNVSSRTLPMTTYRELPTNCAAI